jgi:hypothetical protein
LELLELQIRPNVCMGDGTVRSVANGVSGTTWANACDPRDGNVLGGDF